MSEFFIGQIMMAGFTFSPKYFARCDGQLLPISQNQALFALLGARYGGDGRSNFALPDLRGRTPTGAGPSADAGWQPPPMPIGQSAGAEGVTLTLAQLPQHGHVLSGVATAGDNRNPGNRTFANTGSGPKLFATPGPLVPQDPAAVSTRGGTQPHPNMQPYGVVNFCIALSGIFPSRA